MMTEKVTGLKKNVCTTRVLYFMSKEKAVLALYNRTLVR